MDRDHIAAERAAARAEQAPATSRDNNRVRIETLLLDLYAEAGGVAPPTRTRLRPPPRDGAGLVGPVYMSHSAERATFMDKLAELMVAYNVDRVDVCWSVEHALQNFAERKGGTCGVCGPEHGGTHA